MRNNPSNHCYEIDLYLPSFKVGFEIQGNLHFVYDNKRYSDLKKQGILDLRFFGRHSIVELFPNDIFGDVKLNIIKRIENTQMFYINRYMFVKAIYLEFLRTALVDGDRDCKYMIKQHRVWKRDNNGKYFMVKKDDPVLTLLRYCYKMSNNKNTTDKDLALAATAKHKKLLIENKDDRTYLRCSDFARLINYKNAKKFNDSRNREEQYRFVGGCNPQSPVHR